MGNYFSSQNIETTVSHNKYGWKRDKPDYRDHKHIFYRTYYNNNVDLRDKCPPVYNQGHLGSCTANAIAAAYEFDQMKQNEQFPFCPSRLFIYYNERSMEGHISTDSGAEIRDGMKSINTTGVCPEKYWPYDINKFTEKPSEDCYEIAQNHKTVKYKRLSQTIEQMQECLKQGYPFVFGFTVYSSFESPEVAETGIMTMPEEDDQVKGGHAVMAVGYDNNKKVFIIRNSWGVEWGDNGYFYMPYAYISNSNLASDFWTIQLVNDKTT